MQYPLGTLMSWEAGILTEVYGTKLLGTIAILAIITGGICRRKR
jgi:hypothetical protein